MSNAVLARRYARALYTIAKERNLVTSCQQGLLAFAQALQESTDLRAVLTRDRIPFKTRNTIINNIALALGCDAFMANFLQLLAQKKRALTVPDIAHAFEQLAHADAGIITATVTTAAPVTDAALLTHIQEKMAHIYKRKVQLATKVNESLLGGVLVRVGDEIYDGSVTAYLRRMREQLLQSNG